MQVIRVALWTLGCIGLGIFLASYDVSGHTPVEHATRAFKKIPIGKWERVKDGVKDTVEKTVDDAKKKLSSNDEKPTETHSDDEREAVGKIIAHRAGH